VDGSAGATSANVATQPQSDPTQGGSPGGAPSGDTAPAQGQPPANPKQIALAQMYQLCKKLAQEDPILSAGLQKAAEGIQEAQTAMVTQPAPTPSSSNPPY